MSKYTRGADRTILEDAYAAYYKPFVEDTDPTLEGLRTTLESQSASDAKAAKAEDFVDRRFIDQLRSSGFIDKLYGRR